MRVDPRTPGPDVAIVGAARSGTSLLAAHLAAHPAVDASAVKEPNYFSRNFDRGPEWYERYFAPRAPGLLRLDASVSYTFPQFPEALGRLAVTSPSAFVVYVVRDPVRRAVSHFDYYRHYFAHEEAADFGSALRRDSYYLDVSDYRRWLTALTDALPREQVLVVPFAAVTRSSHAVATVVCRQVGLAAPPHAEKDAARHRNNVVAFRSDHVRRATRLLRHSRFYPGVRRVVGAKTLRRIRSTVTTEPATPSFEESLASCDAVQLEALEALGSDAAAAVADWLAEQDTRLGLGWSPEWPEAAPTA
jgi:hypothetical protein